MSYLRLGRHIMDAMPPRPGEVGMLFLSVMIEPIARGQGYPAPSREAIRRAAGRLVRQGKLVRVSPGVFSLPQPRPELKGAE